MINGADSSHARRVIGAGPRSVDDAEHELERWLSSLGFRDDWRAIRDAMIGGFLPLVPEGAETTIAGGPDAALVGAPVAALLGGKGLGRYYSRGQAGPAAGSKRGAGSGLMIRAGKSTWAQWQPKLLAWLPSGLDREIALSEAPRELLQLPVPPVKGVWDFGEWLLELLSVEDGYSELEPYSLSAATADLMRKAAKQRRVARRQRDEDHENRLKDRYHALVQDLEKLRDQENRLAAPDSPGNSETCVTAKFVQVLGPCQNDSVHVSRAPKSRESKAWRASGSASADSVGLAPRRIFSRRESAVSKLRTLPRTRNANISSRSFRSPGS